MSTTAPEPQRPPAGLRVGEYRLLTRLGEGGMGVVHLAQKPGGPRVALKVLRPHVVGDDEARARLAREVNSLSRVRSRRVAEIMDADPWAEIPYVATRYVPGLSLHDHVQEEGAIDERDIVHVASELCAALDAVHRVGVLHRDVKPSNVLMEGRNPILIDFGLARVADDPRLTHTGWLLGTPGYLAPEILHGEDASPAADVHALASTIAFAALGRAPFGRGPAMAVMDRVRRGEHDLEGVPARLRGPLERALDPDPRRRPTLTELRAWIDPDSLDDATRARVALTGAATGAGADETDLAAAGAATAVLPAIEDPPLEGGTRVMPPEREPYQQPPPPPSPPPRPVARPVAPPVQQPYPPPQQVPQRDPRAAYPPPWPAPAPRRGAGARFRSGVLVLLLGSCVTAAGMLAPWVTAGVVAVLVCVLRAASLGASTRRERRERRGRAHWSDGPLAVLGFPWFLLLSFLGSVALVLWGVLLALSAGLLALALGLTTTVCLALGAGVLAVALWTGPGSSRLRGPVHAVVDPVADPALLWLVFAALLAATAGGTALAADAQGVSWAPAQDAPATPPAPDALWDDVRDAVLFWR
ncbi:putative Ser/Thr protein kinase [Nocardioides zeae]|uniref:Ser/Thr protein kinase n=1 Tax=Nocardioides zeae TaxID=1457234 RepID=A0ACC6IKH0_9ACTN|nr:serine/threonine-protein kinase [Nocardioides zeae]MDR6175276.1 putative Ser/Thr protein kinase [Nocardioides zeae]MDR6211232.1 putative Ser/Thr protein kinase [Nocardioides zeae]